MYINERVRMRCTNQIVKNICVQQPHRLRTSPPRPPGGSTVHRTCKETSFIDLQLSYIIMSCYRQLQYTHLPCDIICQYPYRSLYKVCTTHYLHSICFIFTRIINHELTQCQPTQYSPFFPLWLTYSVALPGRKGWGPMINRFEKLCIYDYMCNMNYDN